MQFLILKREKDEILVVNSSLEKRLSDAQSKAEKVPALEIEKKRLVEKDQHHASQFELSRKEIESLKEKEKTLKERLSETEAKINSGAGIRESFK